MQNINAELKKKKTNTSHVCNVQRQTEQYWVQVLKENSWIIKNLLAVLNPEDRNYSNHTTEVHKQV